MKFRIRVDINSEFTDDKLVKFMSGYSAIAVRHDVNANPHFHAYIDAPMVMSCPAMRARVDSMFKVKGTDRSVKQCDDDRVLEFVQYLFNTKHGNVATLLFNNTISDTDLATCISKADDVAKEYERVTREQRAKRDVITQYDLAQEIADTVPESATIKDYTVTAIAVMNRHRKAFCDFSLRKVIFTAMCHREKGKDALVRRMQEYFQMD